ncbi:MAG: DUF3347 domain-containing protein [Ferruginibacter sp.]
MKKVFAVLVVLLLAFGIYWFLFKKKGGSSNDLKPEPIALKKHSAAFNASVDKMLNAYLGIKDAFVDDDTAKARQGTEAFIGLLDSIPTAELKNDTAVIMESAKSSIADIRSNAVSLLAQSDISEMRQDFRMITEMMYPAFFKTINYEGPKLYLQFCPMAFGEDKGANWISNNTEIVNPYLGKHHPEYKATMLHCGEVKDTIKAQ